MAVKMCYTILLMSYSYYDIYFHIVIDIIL